MDRLLSDFSSLYWWISVVLVGLLINLASAYLKPRLDSWLSNRSERASAKRAGRTAAFESAVGKLAQDPTTILMAGQRLHELQYRTLSVSSFLFFLIVLSIFLGAQNALSTALKILQIIVTVGLPVIMIVHLAFMRMESELEDKVKEARRRYESAGR